jgi:hypothetical protein
MIGSESSIKKEVQFPKLMINQNVVAMFYNEEKAMVVHRLHDGAVVVGEILYENFEIDGFRNFSGSITLSNQNKE